MFCFASESLVMTPGLLTALLQHFRMSLMNDNWFAEPCGKTVDFNHKSQNSKICKKLQFGRSSYTIFSSKAEIRHYWWCQQAGFLHRFISKWQPQLQLWILKLWLLFLLLHFWPHNKDDFINVTRNYFSGIYLLINLFNVNNFIHQKPKSSNNFLCIYSQNNSFLFCL